MTSPWGGLTQHAGAPWLLSDWPVSMATIVPFPPTLPLWLPPVDRDPPESTVITHTNIDLDPKELCII